MLKNYLTIAFRTLRRFPGYAFINISGLALGIACCLLIALVVRDELSYDQFHEQAPNLYRLIQQFPMGERDHSVMSAMPAGAHLVANYPEVQTSTSLLSYWFTPLVSRGDAGFYEKGLLFVDQNFFNVFSFQLLKGNPETALQSPTSLVLTETAARKYFGDEDPMGQTLIMNTDLAFTVTGIAADPPRTSHIQFDLLAALSRMPDVADTPEFLTHWGLQAFHTYLVLVPGADTAALEAKLIDVARAQYGEETRLRYALQPVTAIHLYSNFRGELATNGDVQQVWLLLGIGLVILLLACINYTNLATARYLRRAKEVGIRKVVGAQPRQLMVQFLSESVVFTLLAVPVAFVLLEGGIVLLQSFIPETALPAFDMTPLLWVLLGGIVLSAALLAGGYPAFYLAHFQPGNVLRNATPKSVRAWLRKSLVVFQYATAIVLLAGTGVMYQQLSYMQHKKLGFDKEQVLMLPIRDERLQQLPGAVQTAFGALPEVVRVANSTDLPGERFPATTDMVPEGIVLQEPVRTFMSWIDEHYIETLGVEMVAGRGFSALFPSDAETGLIVNTETVRKVGWGSSEEAIGKRIELWGTQYTIVGVVQDFHFESLREPIKPLLFFKQGNTTKGVIIRVRSNDMPATLARLEAVWKDLSTTQPFAYTLLDDNLARLYTNEVRWSRIISGAAGLAFLIACLGLFGLAAFSAEQRTKEIGIRKVLGASLTHIVGLLSRDFLKLIVLAFAVSVPIIYIVMGRWLEGFAYRTSISVGLITLTGLIALLIAFLTVSYQSVKAAMADPVTSLRYE